MSTIEEAAMPISIADIQAHPAEAMAALIETVRRQDGIIQELAARLDQGTEKRKAADNLLPAERRWENVSVALAIQQAAGRCTRGPGDFSETWILDASFEFFYKRNYNLFESWFKDALCKVVR